MYRVAYWLSAAAKLFSAGSNPQSDLGRLNDTMWTTISRGAAWAGSRRGATYGVAVAIAVSALALQGTPPADVDANRSLVAPGEPFARVPIGPSSARAQAASDVTGSIAERIPAPQPVEPAPLTRADVERFGRSARSVEDRIPVPEPAPLAPITIRDIEPPKAASTSAEPSAPAATAEPASSSPVQTQEAAPLTADQIRKLTGKELMQAPIAAALSGVDAAIAERLRELVANRLDRFIDRRNGRAEVEAFYRDRGFAPIWIRDGAPSARAQSAIAHLRNAHEDGLDPADYPVPNLRAAAADAVAESELRLTDAVLTYARHARTGRVHFSRVGGDILYKLEYPDIAQAMAALAATDDAGAVLASYQPQHAAYKALKAKLAEARNQSGESKTVQIPDGALLRPGMEDPRVPLLRLRLGLAETADEVYDDRLVEAVKAFQQKAGLATDGVLGPNTLRALNGPSRANMADTIIANLERWRWMPRDLGRAYSMLNIPDFTLKVVRNGAVVWRTKVVVGKQTTPTPIFSDTMKYITVNPIWNVPPSIVYNEYIPALHQDPTVMDRMGIRVTENPDGSIHMFQPPGDNNALGRLRFNFPNKFLVYQHDTPDKHLFEKDVRAYSHGCMRVQDPLRYAEVLLSIAAPNEGYTQERIRRMYGPNEININFPNPIPVHITYQTAYVDDGGKLVIRNDVYGVDARLLGILKGSDRRVADIGIERREQPSYSREARLPVGMSFGPRRGYSSRNPFEDFFRAFFR